MILTPVKRKRNVKAKRRNSLQHICALFFNFHMNAEVSNIPVKYDFVQHFLDLEGFELAIEITVILHSFAHADITY